MAIDSMNKVIHAAFRRDLDRLESALGQVAEGDLERSADLHRAWRQVHHQFEHHHTQEEELVFPAVLGMGVEQALLDELATEHAAVGDALAEVDAAMVSYAAHGRLADAAVAREVVGRAGAVLGDHLAHEERDLEPAVAGHVGSPEWKALERRLRKQPPTTSGWFFAWLEDGGPQEARDHLAATVPAPVRFVLSRIFGRGYHREIAPVWR